MRWLVAFLACIGIAQAQIIQHNISDDGYAHVPLQFGFPYYGRIFTDSYMFSNGVVGFGSVNNSWCCNGFDLANTRGYQFDFAIMPLQTDLINYGQGRFLTEGTPQFQRYAWENISEYGRPQNLNTFGLEIRPDGFIGMYYEKVNISPNRIITMGMTGDTSLGEYTQYYHGTGYNGVENVSYITQSTGNVCLANPLSSPSCAGYQEAYLTQQCSSNPLYAITCIGYEQAYHNQQCGINPLYATTCSGYAQAYLTQQCNISQLFSTQCPNYQEAYFNEQCRLNPLYDRTCSGYAEAYALANIVPATTQTVSTTAPSVQVTTTGTVSIETPIVADATVNEVITKPTAPIVAKSLPPPQVPQPEKKEDKKEEKRDVKKVTRTVAINTKPVETSVGIVPNIKTADIPQGFDILDLSHRKLIANLPTIKENNRIRWMMQDSDSRHREMVNEQWRR